MPLIYTVTKKSVTKQMEKLYQIAHHLVCMDGGIEVINEDVIVEYRTGDDPSAITITFQAKMQALIDKYKAEQAIFTNPLLDQQVAWLNTHLTG